MRLTYTPSLRVEKNVLGLLLFLSLLLPLAFLHFFLPQSIILNPSCLTHPPPSLPAIRGVPPPIPSPPFAFGGAEEACLKLAAGQDRGRGDIVSFL